VPESQPPPQSGLLEQSHHPDYWLQGDCGAVFFALPAEIGLKRSLRKDTFGCGWKNLGKFQNKLDKWLDNRILNLSGFL